MPSITLRVVIKISPDGTIKLYRETADTTLGEAHTVAKAEMVNGDVLRVVALNLELPPNPNKVQDPPVDITIQVK